MHRAAGLAGSRLHAGEPIVAGEIVCIWGGRIYTAAALGQMPEALTHYILRIGEEHYIAPPDLAAVDDAELFNHSCDPNCGFTRGPVGLRAMRDIRIGDELTFDYAMSEAFSPPWSCRCGSHRCRGQIRASDHDLPELQQRYAGYFACWLERQRQ